MSDTLDLLIKFRRHMEKSADKMPGIRRIGGFVGEDHAGRLITEFDYDYGEQRFQVTIKEIERHDTMKATA